MVHQKLPRADDLEHRTPGLVGGGEPTRGDGRPRREPQRREVEVGQLAQRRQFDERVVADDVLGSELELGAHEGEHAVGHVGLHLEAHRTSEPATAEFHLDRRKEVLCVLVVEREVGIAGDPEAGDTHDLHAGEQPVEVRLDQILEQDEISAVRNGDEPREVARDLHPGEPLDPVLRIPYDDGKVEGEVGDVRERMRRIDGERREDRVDAVGEVGGERLLRPLAEPRPPDDPYALRCERR